jgi:hypothetical protein
LRQRSIEKKSHRAFLSLKSKMNVTANPGERGLQADGRKSNDAQVSVKTSRFIAQLS